MKLSGKYAEEHADELELERQKVIKDLSASNSEEKGNESNIEGSTDINITDIFDNAGDTQKGDIAEEI